MSKLEQLIKDAEILASQMHSQSEHELAMHDVLPERFAMNMRAFHKYIPVIARRFEDYQVSRPFEIFCTENGIPNLRWKNDNTILYSEDPYAFCLSQLKDVLDGASINRFIFDEEHDAFGQQHVLFMNELVKKQKTLKSKYPLLDTIPESMPLGFMFGLGLGYQLGYLYEQCQVANLFIFEPDEDLFYASLYTFDWAPLLDYLNAENMGLHLFIGDADDDIINVLRDVLEKRAPFLCASTFGWMHYKSEPLMRLVEKITRKLSLTGIGWGYFDDNLFSLAHSYNNISAGVPFFRKDIELSAKWHDVPVFVIANGPSLDSVIELIRREQGKAILVACGTAITALYRAGIKPDIYVAVERVSVVPDSLRTLNDPDYLKDILLLGPDVLHPDCQSLFDDKIYAFKADEPMYSLLYATTELMDQYREAVHLNPLVGNCGVSLLLHLGFNNLYLFGLDNGYRSSEHHHSRLSMYYDDKGMARNEFKAMALAQGDCVIPGNFGGEVTSNQLFSASVMMLEQVISKFPYARCTNCSDGAALAGSLAMRPEKLDLSLMPEIDKGALRHHLVTEMSSPIPIDKDTFMAEMDYPFFDMLITKIRKDWAAFPTSRFALIQLMQRQMEYLYQVSLSRQRHISIILFGSLNSVFTVISNLLFSIENEQNALTAVEELLPTLDVFFVTMQKLYPHALSMIQGQHQQYFD